MSQTFSITGWLLTLHRSDSCIWGDGRQNYDYDWDDECGWEPLYYALAQDWKGSHCPYPKLPYRLRRVFRWRLEVSYAAKDRMKRFCDWVCGGDRKRFRKDGDLHWFIVPIDKVYARFFHVWNRGKDWWFYCSSCRAASFVSLRGKTCRDCGHQHSRTPRYVRWWHRWSLLRLFDWWRDVRSSWWAKTREMDRYSAWKQHDRRAWILRYHMRIPFEQMLQEIGWRYRMFGVVGMERAIRAAADHEMEEIRQRILEEEELPF